MIKWSKVKWPERSGSKIPQPLRQWYVSKSAHYSSKDPNSFYFNVFVCCIILFQCICLLYNFIYLCMYLFIALFFLFFLQNVGFIGTSICSSNKSPHAGDSPGSKMSINGLHLLLCEFLNNFITTYIQSFSMAVSLLTTTSSTTTITITTTTIDDMRANQ